MLCAKLKTMALLSTVAAAAIGASGFAYQAVAEKGNSNLNAARQDPGLPAPTPDEHKGGGNRQETEKAQAQPNDVPQQTDPDLLRDAAKRISEFESEVEAIQKKADAEVQAQRDKLIADLRELQETYTKAGKLDEAVAIRDRIKQIKTAGEKAQDLRVAARGGAAAPESKNQLAGEWLNEGRQDEPCAILQHGRVLLFVNEHGDIYTGRMTEAKKFMCKDGLAGEIAKEGKEIAWSNGSTWKRP
jgi:hypothetical protein